jgi:hypothetical protein
VGVRVGAYDGLSEVGGRVVGCSVGAWLGRTVGLFVGERVVGDTDGVPVGMWVGVCVGVRVVG